MLVPSLVGLPPSVSMIQLSYWPESGAPMVRTKFTLPSTVQSGRMETSSSVRRRNPLPSGSTK